MADSRPSCISSNARLTANRSSSADGLRTRREGPQSKSAEIRPGQTRQTIDPSSREELKYVLDFRAFAAGGSLQNDLVRRDGLLRSKSQGAFTRSVRLDKTHSSARMQMLSFKGRAAGRSSLGARAAILFAEIIADATDSFQRRKLCQRAWEWPHNRAAGFSMTAIRALAEKDDNAACQR